MLNPFGVTRELKLQLSLVLAKALIINDSLTSEKGKTESRLQKGDM